VAIYTGLAFGPTIGETVYQEAGPASTWLFAGIAAGIAFVLAWFIPKDMGRAENPAPRRGLLHPAAILPGSILLLGLVGFTGYTAFLPLYVDEIGVDEAGPFLLVYGVIVLLVRILGARLPDRLGPVRTSSYALVAIAAGIGTIAAIASATGVWIGTVLLAIGMSLLFPALFTLAVNGAPSDERSHAVGTFSLFFDLAQGLGAPALGLAVSAFGTERAAFVVGTVIALAGVVAANTRLRAGIADPAS
jgi:predicted MFS family arabinose efflux permease